MNTFLTQDQFRDAIRKGLGRAILHLKHHGAEPYLDEVIFACTHNTIYNRLCEDSRERYLFRIIALTGWDERVRQAVLDALLTEREYCHLDQLFLVACSYAKRGDQEARLRIYEKFDRNDATEPFIGGCTVVQLDGVAGLIHAARMIGKTILAGTCPKVAFSPPYVGSDSLDRNVATRALEAETASDPAIGAYLAARAEKETRLKSLTKPPTGCSFVEARSLFLSEEEARRTWWLSWARAASPDDLKELAREIERETNSVRLRAYLYVFRGDRPFPLSPERLIELTSSDDDRLAESAFNALAWLPHAKARQFFLDVLASELHTRNVFGLLKRNFERGDESLIIKWLESHPKLTTEESHNVSQDLLGVIEENDFHDPERTLRWIYKKTPCSLCRHRALGLLSVRARIDDDLLNECRYDCYCNTRKYAIQALRKRRSARLETGP